MEAPVVEKDTKVVAPEVNETAALEGGGAGECHGGD